MSRSDPPSIEVVQKRAVAIRKQWNKRRKYRHTAESDDAIRHAYHLRYDYGNKKAIRKAAQTLGWPVHAVVQRARALDLTRTKQTPWTAKEEQFLEQWGWLSESVLAKRMRLAGFHRTATAIHLKLKRLKVRQTLDGYSLRGTAALFGVDEHRVALWIKRGMLKANQNRYRRWSQ